MNRSLTVAPAPARVLVPAGLAVLLAVATVVVPAAPAGAQTADWVDIPVTLSLADGEYFAVVTSEDGMIEAQQQGTTRTFGYPEPAACDGRAGDCYTSDPDGDGSIGFEGDAAVVRAALRSLRFKVNDDVELSDATITVSTSGNPDPTRDLYYNPTNGHYYEFVTDTTNYVRVVGGEVLRSAPVAEEKNQTTWQAAKLLAEAATLTLGDTDYSGYLATITDASESAFTTSYVNAPNVWIGASDDYEVVNAATSATYVDQEAAEANWWWVTGPEAERLQFWESTGANQSKSGDGVRVSDRFEAWKSGEPNNAGGGEHFAILNYNCGTPSTCTSQLNWNDFAGDNENVKSFLVEFGPFPDEVTASLATEVEFSIPELIPAVYSSDLAVVCTPDPVVPAGEVTCEVTGGDPGIDILWRASVDGVFASQGVTLDADGRGVFTFLAPAGADGRSILVELVEWGVQASVAVSGQAVPASLPAGGGSDEPPLTGLATLSLLLAVGLAGRLLVRRPTTG